MFYRFVCPKDNQDLNFGLGILEFGFGFGLGILDASTPLSTSFGYGMTKDD
jgi:hypothetical protein